MAVEILELLEVEARGRLADLGKVEPLDCLVATDDLVVAVTPAKAQQIVVDGFGKHAKFVTIGVHAERAVALAELGAIGAVYQRDMRVGRLGPAHRANDRELAE